MDGVTEVLRLEGSSSSHPLVDEYGERPHIDLLSIAAPAEHFWSAVEECASDCHHVQLLAPAAVLLADPEVDDLQLSSLAAIKNVIILQVAVRDVALMERMQCVQ